MKFIHITIITILFGVISFTSSLAQDIPELQKKYDSEIAAGNLDDAAKTAEDILQKSEKKFAKNSAEYDKALSNMAYVFEKKGNLPEAINYYNERYNNRLADIDERLPTLGMSLSYTKDLIAAVPDQKAMIIVYKKAIARLENVDSVDYSIMMDITNIYSETIAKLYSGDTTQTATKPETLDDIRAKFGKDSKEYLYYIDSMATHYKNRAQYNKAISLFSEEYDILLSKKKGDTQEFAMLCLNLGFLYYIALKYDDAYKYYNEGITTWKKNKFKHTPEYADALFYFGAYYMIKTEWQKVIEIYGEAEEIIRKEFKGDHIMYTSIVASIATCYKVLENYPKAEEYYQKYYDAIVADGDTADSDLLGYYMGVGPIYEKTGKLDKAEQMYVKSNRGTISIINDLMKYISLTSEKRLAQSFVWFNYNLNYFYSFSLKRLDESPSLTGDMYDNELIKKGLILRLIKSKITAILKSGNEELIASFREWMDVRQKLAKLYSLPISERKENVAFLEKRAGELENIMSGGLINIDMEKQLKVSWRDIQAKLKPGEAAVEFMHFDAYDFSKDHWSDSTVYCALILKAGDTYPKLVRLFTEPDFRSFLIRNKGKNSLDQTRKLYMVANDRYRNCKGDSLYAFIWKPIDPYLEGISKVFYSPSGLLHKISFAAIPDENDRKLVKKYSLEQLSSTASLAFDSEPFEISKEYRALLYGGILYDSDPGSMTQSAKQFKEENEDYFIRDRSFDWADTLMRGSWSYLEGTLKEVTTIDSLFRSFDIETKVIKETEAVEESFKYADEKMPEIIHIATHGFFFPEPKVKMEGKMYDMTEKFTTQYNSEESLMRSGLLFAGANNIWKGNPPEIGLEDGILTSQEVSKMDLSNTKLVVLSACETGLGEIKGSEGVYGLQRAFKIAGVEYIIMSLWQIPDEQTVELMDAFYTYWLKGDDINTAFSKAQLEMSEKYEPFFWAAFVLVK